MRKKLCILTIVGLFFASFAGCCDPTYNPVNLAIVSGIQRSNFPNVSVGQPEIYDQIYEVAYNTGTVNIVTVEGQPQRTGDFKINEPSEPDDLKRQYDAKANSKIIIEQLQSSKATTTEADVLAAITKGADCIQTNSKSIKRLLIIDSGLQTTGIFSFLNEDTIDSDPQVLVKELKNLNALPNLNDVEVIWYGLGEVSGEQSELTPDFKTKLNQIWTCILEASGANIEIVAKPIGNNNYDKNDLPYVTPVKIEKKQIDLSQSDLVLDEQTLSFKSNSVEFLNPTKADLLLEPIAKWLNDNPKETIVIIGSTASIGSDKDCLILSQNRANAVASHIINLGGNGRRIKTYGVGRMPCSIRVNDLDSNGKLIEEKAVQNRIIYIASQRSNSTKYKALINEGVVS